MDGSIWRLKRIDEPLVNQISDSRRAFQSKPGEQIFHKPGQPLVYGTPIGSRIFALCMLTFLPGQENWAGDKYGGICPDQDTDDHGKSKIVDNATTENKQGDQHNERCDRG